MGDSPSNTNTGQRKNLEFTKKIKILDELLKQFVSKVANHGDTKKVSDIMKVSSRQVETYKSSNRELLKENMTKNLSLITEITLDKTK